MRSGWVRFAAVVALIAAAAAVLFVSRQDTPYVVHAEFQDASQLIVGDLVQVSGQRAGSVEKVELAPNGTAEVTLHVDRDFTPLRSGTTASVRLRSLLGVTNRYVALDLGPATNAKLPSGTRLGIDKTRSAIDFDTVLDLLTPKVRKQVQRVVKGSAEQFEGHAIDANEGLSYLAPALSSTDRVMAEVGRDRERLRRLVVRGSDLAGDVADRRTELAGLIQHLATTGTTLAGEQAALRDSLGELPQFLEQGDRTLARLRVSLRGLRPLVEESKPVVRRLGPFLDDLAAFSADARPAVRDLARTVSSPGAENDLRDLLVAAPPLSKIATKPVQANGKRRPGAFLVTAESLRDATPLLAFGRPYAIDLTGWFNDFGSSGVYDALGGESRSSASVGAFQNIAGTLFPIPPELRGDAFQRTAQIGFTSRCPGSAERDPGDGSTPYVPPGVRCNPTHVPPGK